MIGNLERARALFEMRVVRGPGCWEFTTRPTRSGYSQLRVDGRSRVAHRISYELHVGPIPEGLHLDHLCRNRRCVNPGHLEAVTSWENTLRGINPKVITFLTDTCARGHQFEETGVYVRPDTGARTCAACVALRDAARPPRKRALCRLCGRSFRSHKEVCRNCRDGSDA